MEEIEEVAEKFIEMVRRLRLNKEEEAVEEKGGQ